MAGTVEDDSLTYSSSGVGDDEGNREYPFITNPKVLEINRKLNELHRKILLQDFVSAASSSDYENCPKGSCMTGHVSKTSIPGPYFSCPVLHESGDDFFPLPFPKQRTGTAVRPKLSVSMSIRSRTKRRKPICRKCSVIAFNHYDASCYHEHYLKNCTYAKLRTGQLISSVRLSRAVRDPVAKEQEAAGAEDDGLSEDSIPNPNSPALSDLKELIDPRKPLMLEDVIINSNKKKRKPQRAKSRINVRSKYQSISGRKARLNTAGPTRSVSTNQEEPKGEDEGPKNPFPMPDVFEEIYFGSMPESFNTLPLALQNFKKTQMKMAGNAGKVEIPTVDPATNKVQHPQPEPVNLLPRLHRPATRGFKPVVFSPPVLSKRVADQPDQINKDTEPGLGLKQLNSQYKAPSTAINNNPKRKSMLFPGGFRKSQQQRLRSSSLSRRNKSSISLARPKTSRKRKPGKSADMKDRGDVETVAGVRSVNFHGEKYRESLMKFIENEQTRSHGDGARGYQRSPRAPVSGRAGTPLTITVYKSVTELGLVSPKAQVERNAKSDSQMTNNKNNNGPKKKGRARAKTARATTAKSSDFSISRRRAGLGTRGVNS